MSTLNRPSRRIESPPACLVLAQAFLALIRCAFEAGEAEAVSRAGGHWPGGQGCRSAPGAMRARRALMYRGKKVGVETAERPTGAAGESGSYSGGCDA